MSQGVLSRSIVLAVLVVLRQTIAVLTEEDFVAEDLDVAYRPMPPDLVLEMKNKTTYELEMEDCMDAFVSCKRSTSNRKTPVCGEDPYLLIKKSYESFCDLTYEECKGHGYGAITWFGSLPSTRDLLLKGDNMSHDISRQWMPFVVSFALLDHVKLNMARHSIL